MSLGLTWLHPVSLGFNKRPHLILPGLAWLQLVSLGFAWSHLVSLGLTWIQLVSLGCTWTHLVSLGLAWSHLDSLRLAGSHLVSLSLSLGHSKPCVLLGFYGPAGPPAPGERFHQIKRTGGRNSNQTKPRPPQNTSELVQEAPESPHDLTEALFKSVGQHSFATILKGTPGARAQGGLASLQTPATGSRAQEPLRFASWTHPSASNVFQWAASCIITHVLWTQDMSIHVYYQGRICTQGVIHTCLEEVCAWTCTRLRF